MRQRAIVVAGFAVALLSSTAARANTATAVLPQAPVFSPAQAVALPEAPRFWPAPRLADMPQVQQVLKSRAFAQNARAAAVGTTNRITADHLFRRIPFGVRFAGEQNTLWFLQDRHVSHIRPVKTAPALAVSPKNIVFEPKPWNIARGARDMSRAARTRVAMSNTGAGIRGLGSTAVQGTRTIGATIRSAATATAGSSLFGAARTGAFAPRALAAAGPAASRTGFFSTLQATAPATRTLVTSVNPAVGIADTTFRWGYQLWRNSVAHAAGSAVLKSAAAGAMAGGVLTAGTELVAGAVRAANCPAGQEATCGVAAVAADSAAPIAVATVTGAAVGAVVKAAALTGMTLSAPVSAVLITAGAAGYLVYTGVRVWQELTPEQKAQIKNGAAATWNAATTWTQQTVTALRFW